MKRIILILNILSVCYLINAQALEKTYGNKFFSLNYPDNWEIVQEDNRATSNVNISVQVMEKKVNNVDFLPNVKNPRYRDNKITFDIGTPSNYSFNSEIIENGCITKGIVYGINSCGKSNLGLAILDIITHLTEKQKLLQSYDFYLNMSGSVMNEN